MPTSTATLTLAPRTNTPVPPLPTVTPVTLACPGDCDNSGQVTIDELMRGVNIALGNMPLAQCPSFDRNRSGEVTIDELIAAVKNALNGCRALTAT